MSRKPKKQNRKKQDGETKVYPVPDRNYKSSLFTMVFSDRKELLGLYNAVSGKQYKDPGEYSGAFSITSPAIGNLYSE